ncbi:MULTISPECIES: hypothetical protein [unclassified Lysobacter]|uniref:hypothetical protein n=1 Tax=unclassified Lysobacter TaxID=2635362 RepID=UPI001BE5B008|nr:MULTISPECIES: hypothetical protein [unclassified Lysobacter]MBT2746932.1 hypothetical protein [Lysobacter sp. ISL-42]MBT2750607.1 hypothetical protein [Lysobacter sp. ISL-50]MBT2776453.1 hypothetical protein [Lysobacter sp. ISL-54]MBT2780948.1 hypothetical protein [Lysobacter sp. ISL-52]
MGSGTRTKMQTPELPELEVCAQTMLQAARIGLLCLLLTICLAVIAFKVRMLPLTYVGGLCTLFSAIAYFRAAYLETRFARSVRRYILDRWNTARIPELDELRQRSRYQQRVLISGWVLPFIVLLLIQPITLTYRVPELLPIYGFVLAWTAMRLFVGGFAHRRILRELEQCTRGVARTRVVTM